MYGTMSLGNKTYGLGRYLSYQEWLSHKLGKYNLRNREVAQWSRVLITQTWGMDFKFQHPCNKLYIIINDRNLSTKWDRDRSITLLDSSLLRKCEVSFRETFSSKEYMDSDKQWHLLWPLCMHLGIYECRHSSRHL